MQERADAGQRGSPEGSALVLEQFFPYRLASLAEDVSEALAVIYRDRFDLSRQEWRVLAILAREGGLTAMEVARRSALDKMQVSRAVQALERKGDLARKPDPSDKRNRRLELTLQGRRLYARIAPIALAREAALLSALSADERVILTGMLQRLSEQAARLRAEAG